MTQRNHSRILKSLSVLCVAALMTACGVSGDGEDVDTLEMWLPSPMGPKNPEEQRAVLEELVEPFEKENDVTIDLTLIPWSSYEEKYLTGVSSGEGPDVGYMYTEMMGNYIKDGAIAPFDEYLDSEAADKMLYLESGQIDGKQYAVPWVVGGMRMLWANMEVLEAAGVSEMPTTWAEFNDAVEKVHESGKIGIQQQWGDPNRSMLNTTFVPLLWQAGGDIFNEEGTATAFNSEAGLEAASFIKGLLDSGAMPDTVSGLDEQAVEKAFFGGEVGFMNGVENQLLEVEEADINGDFVASLENKQKGTFIASDSLVMLEKCPDKQLCTDLVEFMLDGDQMAEFHAEMTAYPPVTTDEVVPEDSDNPFFEIHVNEPDILKSLPIVAGGAEVYNTLYENLQQMVIGQKTPEQALADAAEAGDAALKNN